MEVLWYINFYWVFFCWSVWEFELWEKFFILKRESLPYCVDQLMFYDTSRFRAV